jgi:hypothetical protein
LYAILADSNTAASHHNAVSQLRAAAEHCVPKLKINKITQISLQFLWNLPIILSDKNKRLYFVGNPHTCFNTHTKKHVCAHPHTYSQANNSLHLYTNTHTNIIILIIITIIIIKKSHI